MTDTSKAAVEALAGLVMGYTISCDGEDMTDGDLVSDTLLALLAERDDWRRRAQEAEARSGTTRGTTEEQP